MRLESLGPFRKAEPATDGTEEIMILQEPFGWLQSSRPMQAAGLFCTAVIWSNWMLVAWLAPTWASCAQGMLKKQTN